MRILRRLAPILGLAATAAAACNGNNALCGRRYSDVTFIGSHDSAFVGSGPSDNQYTSVTDQLNLGIRFLQAQTHDSGGTIEMCHSYCWLRDAGPLTNYLTEINNWMNSHPTEVVTLLLTNQDNIAVSKFADVFRNTGLEKYVFRPNGHLNRGDWPTLQQLIDSSSRLVVFMGMVEPSSTGRLWGDASG